MCAFLSFLENLENLDSALWKTWANWKTRSDPGLPLGSCLLKGQTPAKTDTSAAHKAHQGEKLESESESAPRLGDVEGHSTNTSVVDSAADLHAKNMSIVAKPPVFAKREREDDGVRDEDNDYESLPSPAKKCAAR